ncbi:MAG: hypothetical protein JWN75_1121 [Candidatus Saccharibacteria bacterium]|nr:hypothetical protein [Candidatus Saccharibacteria bacterium]
MFKAGPRKTKKRRIINLHQNKWPKGYISTLADSRRPIDSLSDLTNMEIVQDGIARPRPSLVQYGTQPAYNVTGRGKYRWNGSRYEIFMLSVAGVGQIATRKDGGTFTIIGGNYNVAAWTGFCQSNGRVYPFNGVNKLSYLDLATSTIRTYTAIASPVMSVPTKTGLAGTNYTYYYKVAANNDVGTSSASNEVSIQVLKPRDQWDATNSVQLSWSAVTGALSYTVYVSDVTGKQKELTTVNGLTFTDNGSLNVDVFTPAPAGNSTDGPVLNWLYNDARNSQLFGIDSANKLWYSAPGSGDFSPYDGGGYIPIDENGDTQLNYVDGFRNGKGDPVITVSARGAAGKGSLYHVTFSTATYGDQVISYGNVYEANGQSGTYAPRAVIKARDSLYYPTGDSFKSTGTSQNIVNILTTNSFSDAIDDNDTTKIDLANLNKAVGVEFRDKLYFALPVGSTENSEIWYCDLSRKSLWVLRWTVPAKDLWVYEDSMGKTHFCALVNNKILEFTRAGSQTTQDDGTPFKTRVAYSSLVWDEDGITLANIHRLYLKFLYPKGTIAVNAYGLTKRGMNDTVGSATYSTSVTPTGIGAWDYSGDYRYGDDVGEIRSYAQSVTVVTLKPKGLLNQLDWEVITQDANCDYYLSAVNTRGIGSDNLILKN